jgi:ectoine hydroxylase-related dioxygenase (phytanoyl-CoA dioxygenase family)
MYTSMPEAQVWYCDVCSRVDIPHYTAWLPLMPMTYQHGMLQLLSQSHLTYREWINPIVDGLSSGNVPNLPGDYHNASSKTASCLMDNSSRSSSQWLSSSDHPLSPGDLILFNCKTIHAASKNCSKTYRYSMDVRCSYK